MKYYYDVDLTKVCNLDITKLGKHQDKYKKFITEIYYRQNSDGIAYVNQDTRYSCFTRNYYRNIDLDITKTTLNKYSSLENKLFNLLFTKMKVGDNYRHRPSEYKLNIDLTKYFITNGIKLKEDKEQYNSKKKYETKNNTLRTFITIDRQHIISLIQKYNDLTSNDIEDSKEQIEHKYREVFFTRLLKELNNDNKIPIKYNIIDNGRHYNRYSNLKKVLRNEMLHDYNEYDISTASYQWLYDVAKQIQDIEFPLLKGYLLNKKEVRYKLAEVLNTDYNVIKEIITCIGFGGKSKMTDIDLFNDDLQEVIKVPFNAVEIIFKENKIDKNLWTENKVIQAFINEIEKAMKIVSDYHKRKYYDTDTRTLTIGKRKKKSITMKSTKKVAGKWGKGIENYTEEHYEETLGSYSAGKVLAFLYQYYESNFLLAMRDTYVKETKNKDYFLLHDALYIRKDISIETLEQSKQTLEFKINWKLEKE